MTMQSFYHFKCNRCGDEAQVPLQNTARPIPLEGWLTFWVESTDRSMHLCPPCAFGFKAYLEDRTLDQAKQAAIPPAAQSSPQT